MPATSHLIRAALERGDWTATRNGRAITTDELTINPNSINLSLCAEILEVQYWTTHIDLHEQKSLCTKKLNCAGEGLILYPDRLYLASVQEAFDCSAPLWVSTRMRYADLELPTNFNLLKETYFYPVVDGRSTPARAAGLSVHCTAGRGDWGFDRPFTLELTTTLPVKVRKGDELAQLYFEELSGVPTERYANVYANQSGPTPARLGRERFGRGGGE